MCRAQPDMRIYMHMCRAQPDMRIYMNLSEYILNGLSLFLRSQSYFDLARRT